MEWEVGQVVSLGLTGAQCYMQKWMDNRDLLHSTGNHIQYLVITYNGKDSEKVCIYIYIYICTHTHIYVCVYIYTYHNITYFIERETESLFCTPGTGTTLWINYTSIFRKRKKNV